MKVIIINKDLCFNRCNRFDKNILPAIIREMDVTVQSLLRGAAQMENKAGFAKQEINSESMNGKNIDDNSTDANCFVKASYSE